VIDTGLNPEWLRYYFAAKLNSTMEDLDLNLDDFQARVNSDLVGKYVNIASRAAGFLIKRFEGRVQDSAMQHPLLATLRAAVPQIAANYEAREYNRALRQTMELADAVNAYVDTAKPWDQAKDPANAVASAHTDDARRSEADRRAHRGQPRFAASHAGSCGAGRCESQVEGSESSSSRCRCR
jgi:methionyl-tRNA synthetase